ncbi:aminomethyltransferase family protein [Microbispora sp. RL4-1S]|uniref:Aminomethyltransferase family protein n=1 Tax=Microbispora oryzae TaxID=2806554 RepID=A0A940WVD5_9ACTN|nr:aminomethyltransferase family protein [Microbispora oryzae]MBP2707916.1 aminomethyltransferase family protein [Microbispora oryzae]
MASDLATVHPEGTVFGDVGDTAVPLRFSSLSDEYRALRERAVVVDLTGHRLIEITGPAAVEFAQRVLARDVEYLTSDRCTMSLVLDDTGRVVDQVLAFGREDGVLLESSAGAGTRLCEHLRGLGEEGVRITERTDLAVIGLEGPYAWGVVGRLIDPELASLPFESVVDATWNGTDIVFARTGYTGEYGYQMIVPADAAAELWSLALEHASPAGQEALELAMLEVRQPVPRHETGEGATVVEMGANWLIDITKDAFVGREATLAAFADGGGRRVVGFTGPEGVPAPGTRVLAGGQDVGEVVYAVHSVGLDATLGLARVDRDLAAAGLDLTVGGAEVTTLTSPYVVPKSWSIPII